MSGTVVGTPVGPDLASFVRGLASRLSPKTQTFENSPQVSCMVTPSLFDVNATSRAEPFESFALYVLGNRRTRPRSAGAEDGRKSPTDTPLLVPGIADPERRHTTHMRTMTMAVLDLDKVSEHTLSAVVERLEAEGLEFFGYSTWSDLRYAPKDQTISCRILLPLSRPVTRPASELAECTIAVEDRETKRASGNRTAKIKKIPFAEWRVFRFGLDSWLGDVEGGGGKSIIDENTHDAARAYYLPVTQVGMQPWNIPHRRGVAVDVEKMLAIGRQLEAKATRRPGKRNGNLDELMATGLKVFGTVELGKLVDQLESRGISAGKPLRAATEGRPYSEVEGDGHSQRLSTSKAIARFAPALILDENGVAALWEALGPSFEARARAGLGEGPDEDWEDFLRCLESALEKVAACEPGFEPWSFASDPYEGWGANDHERHVMPLLRGRFYRRIEDSGSTLVEVATEGDSAGELLGGRGVEDVERTLGPLLKDRFGPPKTRVIQDGVRYWGQQTPAVKLDVPAFRWPGDRGLCSRRMPFTVLPGEYPAWGEFLGRLSDPMAFMAWVWSVFENKDKGRQILWLHGDGQDGKSCIMRVLADTVGNAATSVNDMQLSSNEKRFLNSALYGKRFVIYPDCKNTTFCVSSHAHTWSGGDKATIEMKGRQPFQTTLCCKIMVGANEEPITTSKKSDKTRILYIKVAETKQNTGDWEERLTQEMPGFLFDCRIAYGDLANSVGDIQGNQRTHEALVDLIDAGEEPNRLIFDQYFIVSPGSEVAAGVMEDIRCAKHWSKYELGQFIKYLERVQGIKQDRTKTRRFYPGIKRRPGY